MPSSTGLLLKALAFAAHKHRDQRRKNEAASPYINHPIALANVLWQEGGVRDAAVLAAALLHDTIEDTDTKPEELRAVFAAVEDSAIADIMLEVTDDKALPKAERKLQCARRGQRAHSGPPDRFGPRRVFRGVMDRHG